MHISCTHVAAANVMGPPASKRVYTFRRRFDSAGRPLAKLRGCSCHTCHLCRSDSDDLCVFPSPPPRFRNARTNLKSQSIYHLSLSLSLSLSLLDLVCLVSISICLYCTHISHSSESDLRTSNVWSYLHTEPPDLQVKRVAARAGTTSSGSVRVRVRAGLGFGLGSGSGSG